jgi:membrane protein YdbS with pleckstrin-like domain
MRSGSGSRVTRAAKVARVRGIERYLADGERVVFVLRRHVVELAPAVGMWLLALGLGVLAGFIDSAHPSWHAGVIGGWVVLAGGAALAIRSWAWWGALYVLTDRRVLLVEGVIGRRVRAVPLSKVTHTDYQRSFLGRIFGYGALSLDSPGAASGLRELTNIPRPDEIYRLIMSLVETGPAPATRPAVPDASFDDTGPLPRLIL